MERREFITLLGSTAGTWPLVANAQQKSKAVTIGFLGATSSPVTSQWTAAFAQRLSQLGWIDGRNVAIDNRWAEGSTENMIKIALEFAQRKVDVIVAQGTQAALAAKAASTDIPIVFVLVGDPVGSGLTASLAHPGANATGPSSQSSDLAGKRLGLFRELIPDLRRVAALVNLGNPSAILDKTELTAAAISLTIEIVALGIHRSEEIGPAIESINGRADALYAAPDALILDNLTRINTLALSARLPTMYGAPNYVRAGGLMSYGTNFTDMFQHAAVYVDKILRGATPSQLPVEQPTKFELVINLTTARVLGLTVSPNLLARADEVIE